MQQPLSNQKVPGYLRLEEAEDTAELLTAASLRYLGAFPTARGLSHFWSFPTVAAVAWAELTEGRTLTRPREVPQAVREATPARAEHKTKKVAARPRRRPWRCASSPSAPSGCRPTRCLHTPRMRPGPRPSRSATR
jgi:hypothetical protein